jgi:hypothetical protein
LLRIDPKFLHSSEERRAVHSQAGGSTIRATDAPPACGERSINLIALPSFILIKNAGFVALGICSFSNDWLEFTVVGAR